MIHTKHVSEWSKELTQSLQTFKIERGTEEKPETNKNYLRLYNDPYNPD